MKRYIQVIACASLICLSLLGCGKENVANSTLPPKQQETVATSIADTDTDTGTETQTASTRRITQELSENRSIDAEAVIPGKQQYSAYTLKRVDGNPDRLFGIFSPDGHGTYTTEDCGTYMLYRESSGKKLVVREDAIDYSSYDVDSGNQPMQEVVNLMYYYTLEHPQAQPRDLSFMTVAEMEEYCKNILTQLGVAWDAELVNFVTLSGQEILDFQKEMFGKSSYTEFGTPMTLTAAEDACYLEFTFSYDGVPLYGPNEPNLSYVDGVIPPMPVNATILLNADGIQSCDVRCACFIESASDPQNIISVDDGISCLKSHYDMEIPFGTMEITDIWMEYIPVMQGQSLVLTPYWCFKEVDSERGEVEGFAGTAQRFNAFTGKNLIYGG